MPILIFFIGLWIGGLVGVFTMCLFQISGKNDKFETVNLSPMNNGEEDRE